MAVDLRTLAGATARRANGPSGALFDDDEDLWVLALADGFWSLKVKARTFGTALFDGYRITTQGSRRYITAVDGDVPEDMDELDQHTLSAWTAMSAVESFITGQPSVVRDAAGAGISTEVQFSPQVMKARLDAIREDMKALIGDYKRQGTRPTQVHVLNGILSG